MSEHRYRVVGSWGRIPEQVADLIGREDGYLVYPEYRGPTSSQGFTDNDALVGGWEMVYAGQRSPDEVREA